MKVFVAVLLLVLLPCLGSSAPATQFSDAAWGSDLIVNGSFEAGNNGFVTACRYSHGDIFRAGEYDITDNPRKAHPYASSYGDHTTGAGSMMVINGFQGVSSVLWSETLAVVPDATYEFSAWVSLWSAGTPANLDFLFNGISVGTLHTGTADAQWKVFNALWYSHQDSTLTIEVVDLLQFGADIALDDIVLNSTSNIDVTDVPNDQGGQLQVSWGRHLYDSSAESAPVTDYEVQRFSGSWQTLAGVVATGADTYGVTVPTTDVFTLGQAAPYSRYRVVANTSEPSVFYSSAVDSAYSIDNLAPPKPNGFLVEARDWRIVACSDPQIPDLAQVCFYRGSTTGFAPSEALSCSPAELSYYETQTNNYFYRIQFKDTHGNLSDFSDEMALQFPTNVDSVTPAKFALEQNQPNPFNPSTTLKFSLANSATVSLGIYDVAGKFVRSLIAGQVMGSGQQEKVWDGRDDEGRLAPAGVYFYKLTAGEFVEVRRMALVK